ESPILKAKILDSNTDQSIKDQVESQLKLVEYILRGTQDKYKKSNPIYEKIKSEQDDLKNRVHKSLEDNNKITHDEILKLRLELGDILKLADTYEIHEKKGWFSNGLWDSINGINRSDAENNADILLNKDITAESFTQEEALIFLQHTNKEYSDYSIGDKWSVNEIFNTVTGVSSLGEVKTTRDARVFQDQLIVKILGNNKGYNHEYIKGYGSTRGGNFLISKVDFQTEMKTKDVSDWNSLAFANYIQSGKMSSAKLIEKIGYKKALQLSDLWTKNTEKDGGNHAKNILETSNPGIVEDVEMVSETFSSVENISNNFNTLSQDKNKLEIAQKYLEQDNDAFKTLQSLIISKLEGKVENPELLSKEIIEKVIQGNVTDIFLVLNEYEEEYSVELRDKKTVSAVAQAQREKINTDVFKALKSGDTQKVELLKKKEQELIILEHTMALSTQEEFESIFDEVKNNRNFTEIVSDLRIENKKLDSIIKTHEYSQDIIQGIDIRVIDSPSYTLEKNPIIEGNNVSFTTQTGTKIDNISLEEYKTLGIEVQVDENGKQSTIIENKEAMKNLINFKEKTKELNIDFVWEYRDILIQQARNMLGVTSLDNNDGDLLSTTEFNKLLNFILILVGKKGSENSISGTYAKIIEINGGGMLNDKKDFKTGYSNIGMMFYAYEYIGESSIDTKHITNMQNYKDVLQKNSPQKK
ncbi:MAG: hypothetical protein GY828_01795, partial [Candidatus Gracilibacteria bacterium]|nr:hypothetical protein [Candidatus Gracilibacteria bacterium]